MGQNLECSKCHCKDFGKFRFDETGKFFICECGAINKLYDSYNVVKHEGTVEVDGIATKNSTLETANMFLRNQEYDKASKKYKEVLALEPTNFEAWWGRFQCEDYFARYYGYQDKYGNSTPYTKASIIQENLTLYAYKAIEYAPPEKKEEYKAAIIDFERYIEDVKSGVYDEKPGFLKKLTNKLKK